MRPVYPQPGYSEADLEALLDTRQFTYAECFTITLLSGEKFRYTTWQNDITVVPVGEASLRTFTSRDVLIEGLRFRIGIGVEVDEQTITLRYPASTLIMGATIPQALRLGYLDGARIERDRYFRNSDGVWIAGIPMFHGRVSSLDSVGRTQAKLKVKSDLVLLNVDMPRKVFQPTCTHTLFDFGCTLDRSLFAVTVVMATGTPTEVFLPWPSATDDYTLGSIHIENGVGVTLVRTVREAEAGVGLHLAYPLDFVPDVGDQFVAYPGCNRTLARCTALANTAHYQAFPFVPVSETAI